MWSRFLNEQPRRLCRPSFHIVAFVVLLLHLCSGIGPDSRVLVRNSRKSAQSYYNTYKVPLLGKPCILEGVLSIC